MKCIDMGRRYRQSGNEKDSYEAFRLLGQALHTLEDFTAHSNFCELGELSWQAGPDDSPYLHGTPAGLPSRWPQC